MITSAPPLRRVFGTVTAVRVDLLEDAARVYVGAQEHIARYELRDRLSKSPGLDWRATWMNAVARGKAIESDTLDRTTEQLADAVIPKGGKIVRDVRDVAKTIVGGIAGYLPGGKNPELGEHGKAAIGAALTTPLTKAGFEADVVFSTATGVTEAALRGAKANDLEGHIDTATAITYEVSSGVVAGAVGTLVATVATPAGGIAAAVATKLGIDAIRDPIVWKCAEMFAGARAAFAKS